MLCSRDNHVTVPTKGFQIAHAVLFAAFPDCATVMYFEPSGLGTPNAPVAVAAQNRDPQAGPELHI